MRKTVVKILVYTLGCVLTPFIITILMNGTIDNRKTDSFAVSSDKTLANYSDIYGTVAAYYRPGDSAEFLKAIAVMARTYERYMKSDNSTKSTSYTLEHLSQSDMKKEWKKEYDNYYKQIKEAVELTDNEVITYNGATIFPYCHMISAGMTRDGNQEYLSSVDSSEDISNLQYINVISVTEKNAKRVLSEKLEKLVFEGSVANSFQILSRDNAGYITEIMVGGVATSGDRIKEIFGLDSADFTVAAGDGEIIFTVKGKGDGYGVSIEGARQKASAGMNYKDILAYYYKNIDIICE